MAITMTLDDFVSSHASDFVKVELAISGAIFDIVGGAARPIVQIDSSNPIASIDPLSGEINIRFNGRLVMMAGVTSKQLGDILSTAMTSLGLFFEWSEEGDVMKFTVVMALLSFDPSVLIQEPTEPEDIGGGPAESEPGYEPEEAPAEEAPAEETEAPAEEVKEEAEPPAEETPET